MLARRMLMKPSGAPVTYATFSPLANRKSANITLSNGNLSASLLSTASPNTVYLAIDKTSGLWAFEITNSVNMNGSNLTTAGVSTSLVLNNYIGFITNSVCCVAYDGRMVNNSSTSSAYYDGFFNSGTKRLYVFDANTRKILCSKSGVLKASTAVTGTNPLYMGLTIYGTNTHTLNAGQSAFSVENESLLSAYEAANGVAINRGVWA